MPEYNYTHKAFKDLTLDELYDILKLRQEVFVVEQDCPYQDADDIDKNAIHVMAHDANNTLVAYTRLLGKGISYPNYCSIGRVVNSQSTRGKGIGKKIMELSIRLIQDYYPDSDIKISAQTYLDDFYTSLGFRSTGTYYLEDNIPHQAMIFKVV